jgi:hypothetical protein
VDEGVANARGIVSDVSVDQGGIENVLSGGIASGGSTIGTGLSGGTLNVSSGGAVAWMSVLSGDWQIFVPVASTVSLPIFLAELPTCLQELLPMICGSRDCLIRRPDIGPNKFGDRRFSNPQGARRRIGGLSHRLQRR